jgi:sterol desaturase/sphingolipid hydroxylase (fatty acid hydroxylase superfamily)
LFFSFIAIELTYKSFDDKQLYKWKDLVSSLSLGIGSAVVAALVKNSCCNIGFNVAYDLFNPMVDGVHKYYGLGVFGYAWYIWVICMLLDDFSYYWFHRQNHMIRFLGTIILQIILI